MKLRQKLAVVLAASMIATAVPVVTMAATTNSINCDIKVRDGSKLGYNEDLKVTIVDGSKRTTVSALTINNSDADKFEDRSIPNLELFPKDDHNATAKGETFYIDLEDGEFNFAAYYAAWNNADVVDDDIHEFSDVMDLGDTPADVTFEKDGKLYALNKSSYCTSVSNGYEVTKTDFDDHSTLATKAEDAMKNGHVLRYVVGGTTYADFVLTSDKQMEVTVYGLWEAPDRQGSGDSLQIPLFVKAKSTQVKVKIDGSDSFVSTETKTIGVANEDGKELTITADDAKTAIPYDGGEISKLILTEEVLSAIEDSENAQIKLELPASSDLEWEDDDITATGKRAFSGKEDKNVKTTYGRTGRNSKEDKQVLIIQLPKWSDNNARGVIELTGIKVQPEDDTATTGELSIKVSAVNDDDFVKEKSLVVGVVTEYDVNLTCEKPASIKAGRSALVNKYNAEVVLAEAVKDSLVTGRDIKFTLENGYIIGAADILEWMYDEKYFTTEEKKAFADLTEEEKYNQLVDLIEGLVVKEDSTVVSSPSSDRYKNRALATIRHLVENEDIKFSEDAEVINKDGSAITDVEVNSKGQVIGFTIDGDKLEDGTDDDKRLDDGQRDDVKMKLPVATSLQSTGEVTLVASGRALAELGQEDKVSCKIADIVSPIKVDMVAANLKVGLQEQTAGSIVINETDKGMIEKGTIIVDANPQEEYGIKFQNVPKVEATNLKLGDVELSSDKRYLYIEVEKTSTEAGKISITDATFTTDRTVPEGTFPVRFYGSALTDEEIKTYDDVVYDKYVVDDFIKITTPNTEDIKNGALKAVTSSFTLDSAKYTVDGVEYQMDAPAYSKDGRTMVPVRYLAYAFGLNTENVTFANGTATIIAGEKVIQVKLGSDVLYVNGSPIQMDAKAELKDGRAYVPMKFIAVALGVSSSWDSATKTATFSNVATK